MKASCSGMIMISDKMSISVFFFISLFFLFFSQGVLYSSVFLLSAVLHEYSHIFFLYRFGVKPSRIFVYPFGIDIRADTTLLSYKKELICTLSGCLANFVFALFGFIALQIFPNEYLLFFILCNIFLGCINLIPLSFFDGGRALRLVLYDRLEIDTAFYIYKYLDMCSAIIFICFSFFIMNGSDFNFSVCAVILYASISALALCKKQSA